MRALCGTIDHRKIDKVFFSRRAMEVQMRQRESQHCGTKRLIHHQRTYFFVVLCAKHCTISPAQYGIQLFVGCLLFARRHSFNTKCLMCFDSMGSQFICEFWIGMQLRSWRSSALWHENEKTYIHSLCGRSSVLGLLGVKYGPDIIYFIYRIFESLFWSSNIFHRNQFISTRKKGWKTRMNLRNRVPKCASVSKMSSYSFNQLFLRRRKLHAPAIVADDRVIFKLELDEQK